MNIQDFQPFIDLAMGKSGVVSALPVWVTTASTICRVIIKPFNARLQAALTRALANAKQNEVDAAWWKKILNSTIYRLLAFALDVAFSVKLPTYADFCKMLEQLQAAKVVISAGEPELK